MKPVRALFRRMEPLRPETRSRGKAVVGDEATVLAGIAFQQDLARRGDHRVLRVPVVEGATLVEAAKRPPRPECRAARGASGL